MRSRKSRDEGGGPITIDQDGWGEYENIATNNCCLFGPPLPLVYRAAYRS